VPFKKEKIIPFVRHLNALLMTWNFRGVLLVVAAALILPAVRSYDKVMP
jgi:hypothetical protein